MVVGNGDSYDDRDFWNLRLTTVMNGGTVEVATVVILIEEYMMIIDDNVNCDVEFIGSRN